MRINYNYFADIYSRRKDPKAGPARALALFEQCLGDGSIRPGQFSLRSAAEALVFDRAGKPCGREWVETLRPGSTSRFLEAGGDVVSTAAFSNITGQIVYSALMEAYESPAFLWPELCTTVQTEFSGEKIPGISAIGDEALTVEDGEPYPRVGVTQRFIETPATVKKGFIVPVTKEAVFFDRTNLVLDRCSKIGESLGLTKEKAVMNVVTGQTNNFKMNGTAYDTYVTTGGHGIVNSLTNALLDHTDINEVMAKFDAMTDWDTGEPITVIPDVLLVPQALVATAARILSASEVRFGTSNTSGHQTLAPNLIPTIVKGQLRVLNNPFVKGATSSDAYWFIGQPKKAFRWMQNWDFATAQQGANSDADFDRDIVQQYKGSYRGVAAVLDPHYMCNSTGAS